MGKFHRHASDDLVEFVFGLGFLAVVVGVGVVVIGLLVTPPAPCSPVFVGVGLLGVEPAPVIAELEDAALEGKVSLVIAALEEAAASLEAAAPLSVQKPTTLELLSSAARAVSEVSAH